MNKLLSKYWPIIVIVFFALFFRLYRISEYLTFLGDEGRDALVWLKMVRLEKFTLIGPQTSIGNMYLGPLFYYLMLPFYALFGTVGPSVATALFAGGTTFLLWYAGRDWFGERVGIIAALLYAVSPTAIVLSHSAWNPNIMPFFAFLVVWGIWQFWQKDKTVWLLITGVTFSVVVQSHYLGLLLGPLVGLFVIIKLIHLVKFNRPRVTNYIVFVILSSVFFILLTIAPLVWFDIRHGFINFKAMQLFFTDRQATVNFKPYKALPNLWPLWESILTRLIVSSNVVVGKVIAWVIPLTTLSVVIRTFPRLKLFNKPSLLLAAWLTIGLIGLGLYKQHIYDHYFGFIFPALFLTVAITINQLTRIPYLGKALFYISLAVVIFLNLRNSPLLFTPNNQMERTKTISQKILSEANSQSFNIGLIAKQNYDAGYRYFLELAGRPSLSIDPQRLKETVSNQLFVICEVADCQPTTSPQAEIANFGWTKIDKEWAFPWGAKLYRLIPNKL